MATIDPFKLLDAINGNAPFTMGTVGADKWSAYENQLLAGQVQEQNLAAAKKKQAEDEAKKSLYANLSLTKDDGTPKSLKDLYSEVAGTELKSGNVEPTLKLTEMNESQLKKQADDAEKRQKEQANLLKDIFQIGTKNPAAAQQMMEAYKNLGALQSDINLPQIAKDPEKPDKPDKSASKIAFRMTDPNTGETVAFNSYGQRLDINLPKMPKKGTSSNDTNSILTELGVAPKATPVAPQGPAPSANRLIVLKRPPVQ